MEGTLGVLKSSASGTGSEQVVQGLIQSHLEIPKARDCTASLGDLMQHLPEPMGTRFPYVLAEPLLCHYPSLPFVLPPETMVRSLALYSPCNPCRYRQPVPNSLPFPRSQVLFSLPFSRLYKPSSSSSWSPCIKPVSHHPHREELLPEISSLSLLSVTLKPFPLVPCPQALLLPTRNEGRS